MFLSIDTVWVLICAILVFFMQAGFAMLETGFTRMKNAGNIIMKNLLDFCIGVICYGIIGFGLMYGETNGFIGSLHPFAYKEVFLGLPGIVFLVWQMFFCATSATIVSGAMAERTRFLAYVIYSALMSAVIYPLSGCWIWNHGGWLYKMGFHDWAGGAAVHLVGGVAGFAGAWVLGPRLGKYRGGNSRAIPGHNLPLAAMGVFMLFIGWFGFNGGSTLSATGDVNLLKIGSVLLNTTLSAAVCAVTTMCITWFRYGKSDVSFVLNSVVAGLVVITAGADQVTEISAIIMGFLAAFALVFGIEFIDNRLRVDDPVGASAVHGICGGLGVILTGIFSKEKGVLYTGRFDFFGIQLFGALVIAIWTGGIMLLVFRILKAAMGIRVSEKSEIEGLDRAEHGLASSYMDFINSVAYGGRIEGEYGGAGAIRIFEQDTPFDSKDYQADGKIRKVVVMMNSSKFEALMEALDEIDITGMTVSHVSGCGIQKGNTEYYHGAKNYFHLLPKLKVEIVISTVPLALLIDVIKRTLYTGNIGDGKIFIYEVEQVIKVRTNEEGSMALE